MHEFIPWNIKVKKIHEIEIYRPQNHSAKRVKKKIEVIMIFECDSLIAIKLLAHLFDCWAA